MSYLFEEWKPVVGYEGVYEVSSQGSVKRVGKAFGATPGRILAQHPNHSGYPGVKLRNKGNDKTMLVHILVARAFLGPCPDGFEVNHKDKLTTDPSISNLEYATSQGNKIHAARNGSKHYKLTPELVIAIRHRYRELGHFAHVASEFGIDASYCGKIIRKQYWANID